MSNNGLIGLSVARVEDDRLLRGAGRYVDDLHPEGVLHAAFLRSPHAHARIAAVDVAAARAAPGVVAVIDGAEACAAVPPMLFEIAKLVPPAVRETVNPTVRLHPMPAMPVDRVTYVGQPVAMVIAADRYLAEDALELIEVDYEPLPAVADPEAALAADAPRLNVAWDDNVAIAFGAGKGDPERAFAEADVVVEERFRSHRQGAAPIETRGVVAVPGAVDGGVTVWSSTQTPHLVRDFLAAPLGLAPERVRVVAPDVGGSFGLKGSIYPEDLLVPLAALRLGRPVKWIEDRSEHLVASTQGREQVHEIALAATRDGRIVGVRDSILINSGAFSTLGLVVPYNSFTHLLGPYDVAHVRIDVRAVITNTAVTAPYRGAGRPEAVFAMERAIDRLAATLELDPLEVRRRNLIRANAMPYATGFVCRDGEPQVYDSGDYSALLERCAELVGDRPAAAGGEYVGVGYAAYVEGTGLGPFESAAVAVAPSGRVSVRTGASSQGQGHRTTLAQIAAETLGVPIEDVDVVGGDTEAIAHGFGTIGSRTLVAAGSAVAEAAGALRRRALDLAADLFEVGVEDLELSEGTIRVKGGPVSRMTLGEVAGALSPWNPARPPRAPATLEESAYFRPPTVTWAAAVHAAIVRVDAETGVVEVLRYVVVHDCGRAVNPAIVDGQVMGGVMQGIGGALYEELVYDEDGQPRSGSFMDYLLPTASEAPEFELAHLDSPSPLNPLGVKGSGEGGAIGPQAAIANAVEDALRPLGVVVREVPLSPDRVRASIRRRA